MQVTKSMIYDCYDIANSQMHNKGFFFDKDKTSTFYDLLNKSNHPDPPKFVTSQIQPPKLVEIYSKNKIFRELKTLIQEMKGNIAFLILHWIASYVYSTTPLNYQLPLQLSLSEPNLSHIGTYLK